MSTQTATLELHGVRYQVADVSRAVAFYTTHLGFTLEHQQLPAFAAFATTNGAALGYDREVLAERSREYAHFFASQEVERFLINNQ